MSRKHFSWLFFITFIVAAAVLMLPSRTGDEGTFEESVLLPGLEQQVNDISWVRLTGAGNTTIATLERTGERWVIVEASRYPADWENLKTLLSDLALAAVIEPKTANPKYYDRLGVEDVDAENAGGVLIEFADSSGLPAVIIGKSAQGREGQYARRRGETESVLLDRGLELSRERTGWLSPDIVDVSDAEVVEYEITHPDGERILASKISADDQNFSLGAVPEGREVSSDWVVNAPANTLADLTMDAVSLEDEIDWTESVHFRLLTADGLQLEADLVSRNEEGGKEPAEASHWIRLRAGIYTTALDNAVEISDDKSEPLKRAESINSRVRGWAYQIPKYKFDSMTKRMTDLLKPEES